LFPSETAKTKHREEEKRVGGSKEIEFNGKAEAQSLTIYHKVEEDKPEMEVRKGLKRGKKETEEQMIVFFFLAIWIYLLEGF
jgi:hypothetical protein